MFGANFYFTTSAGGCVTEEFCTNIATPNVNGPGNWTLGNEFTVGASDITITSLGTYDQGSEWVSSSNTSNNMDTWRGYSCECVQFQQEQQEH